MRFCRTEMGLQGNLQLWVFDAAEHHRWTHIQRPLAVSCGKYSLSVKQVLPTMFKFMAGFASVSFSVFSFPGSCATTPQMFWTWMIQIFSGTCLNQSVWSTQDWLRMSKKSESSFRIYNILHLNVFFFLSHMQFYSPNEYKFFLPKNGKEMLLLYLNSL